MEICVLYYIKFYLIHLKDIRTSVHLINTYFGVELIYNFEYLNIFDAINPNNTRNKLSMSMLIF